MVEMDGDTINALLRIYGVRDYSSKVAWLCLSALLTLGSLGWLLHQSSGHRYLKLGTSICIIFFVFESLVLHWQYQAVCTDKKTEKVHSVEVIKFESGGGNTIYFGIAVGVLIYKFFNWVV